MKYFTWLQTMGSHWSNFYGMNMPSSINPKYAFAASIFILALVIWSIIWKGIALWHAARKHQVAWFVVLLIVNTAGILEIVYLLFFQKDRNPGAVDMFTPTPPPSPDASAPLA